MQRHDLCWEQVVIYRAHWKAVGERSASRLPPPPAGDSSSAQMLWLGDSRHWPLPPPSGLLVGPPPPGSISTAGDSTHTPRGTAAGPGMPLTTEQIKSVTCQTARSHSKHGQFAVVGSTCCHRRCEAVSGRHAVG